MEVLHVVTVTPLMERTRGRPEIAIGQETIAKAPADFEGENIHPPREVIGFVNGPFAVGHPFRDCVVVTCRVTTSLDKNGAPNVVQEYRGFYSENLDVSSGKRPNP